MDNPRRFSQIGFVGKLVRRHYLSLSLTYSLTLLENISRILFPAVIGWAVDGLLSGNPKWIIPMVIISLLHLGSGLMRHIYDTRVFTAIYAQFVSDMVGRQKQEGIGASRIAGRVSLTREVVDFLQYELPAVVADAIAFFGAIIMLFAYDPIIAGFALAVLLPVFIVLRCFSKRALRLNNGLNNRIEREVDIITTQPSRQVKRHFLRLRFWYIAISNAEAATWGITDLSIIFLAIATLLRLAQIEGISSGEVYAVLAYVWSLRDATNDLPVVVQNIARVRDIGKRIADQ